MRRFRREPSGALAARFDSGEAELLARLAAETSDILADAGGGDAAANDPALARLLPDAYPDDVEASAEFRRFTAEGLAARKLENSKTMVETLSSSGRHVDVLLNAQAAQAWLRALTDIRLVLASRLGIERDGDVGFRGTAHSFRRSLEYQWVGYVQESLIRALNAPARR